MAANFPGAIFSGGGETMDRAQSTAKPVNAFSNAVDPRLHYPHHFDHLMRHLFTAGEQPECWRVLDAAETRLDEYGMEVEFTLVQRGTNLVWRRRVLISAGQLVAVQVV